MHGMEKNRVNQWVLIDRISGRLTSLYNTVSMALAGMSLSFRDRGYTCMCVLAVSGRTKAAN